MGAEYLIVVVVKDGAKHQDWSWSPLSHVQTLGRTLFHLRLSHKKFQTIDASEHFTTPIAISQNAYQTHDKDAKCERVCQTPIRNKSLDLF